MLRPELVHLNFEMSKAEMLKITSNNLDILIKIIRTQDKELSKAKPLSEITYRQHIILDNIQRKGPLIKTGKEISIDWFLELTKKGYLKNSKPTMKGFIHKFSITQKGIDYLKPWKD